MATYAAAGLRAKAHFVRRVSRADKVVYPETLTQPYRGSGLTPEQVADLDWVLSQSGRAAGIDAALKTGEWRFDTRVDQNSDAWAVGFTGSLAMAVWVGDKRGDQPLIDNNGATVGGSGLPTRIFQDFMSTAHEAMGLHLPSFPPPVFGGRADPPGSVSR
jgi:membrane peptidoglycan carboxypeptidase